MTRDELLFGHALAKQKIVEQRKIVARAINKNETFLARSEMRIFESYKLQLKKWEEQTKLASPVCRVA
jgi:hypothetical protein